MLIIILCFSGAIVAGVVFFCIKKRGANPYMDGIAYGGLDSVARSETDCEIDKAMI